MRALDFFTRQIGLVEGEKDKPRGLVLMMWRVFSGG